MSTSTEFTLADLAKIEALAAAATPGPWAWEAVSHDDNSWCLGLTDPPLTGELIEGKHGEMPEVVEHVADSGTVESKADAAFIAAARTLVPALCAALRRSAARHDADMAVMAAQEVDHRADRERWRDLARQLHDALWSTVTCASCNTRLLTTIAHCEECSLSTDDGGDVQPLADVDAALAAGGDALAGST